MERGSTPCHWNFQPCLFKGDFFFPKGWIPKSVINYVLPQSQVDFIKHLRQHLSISAWPWASRRMDSTLVQNCYKRRRNSQKAWWKRRVSMVFCCCYSHAGMTAEVQNSEPNDKHPSVWKGLISGVWLSVDSTAHIQQFTLCLSLLITVSSTTFLARIWLGSSASNKLL